MNEPEQNPNKPWKARLQFGETPEPGANTIYEYATEAELDAFLEGISEATGWLETCVVETCGPGQDWEEQDGWTAEPTDQGEDAS